MKFALVVPALNEEAAIAGTLRRTLAARAKVCAQTPVTEMVVVFVNDGSTDRTQEIVDQPEFADVVKVHFIKNRGYGAAIKAGWQATDADLVGFIDGDGTCEPDFCVQLINHMVATKSDVVLAARLNPDTQMPLIRKIGNRIFALLLGVMAGKLGITDTASGFRICRRASLNLMSPLPDGLHFTPTQSAICLLDPRLKIEEVHGMHYKEREGRSKLHVVKDGFRFLWTILFAACCYAPIKTMMMASAIVALTGAAMASAFLLHGEPLHLVIPLAEVTLSLILVLLFAGVITHEANYLLIGPRQTAWYEKHLQASLDYRRLIVGGIVISAVGLGFIFADFFGPYRNPWLQALLDVVIHLMPVLGGLMFMTGVLSRVFWAVGEKQKALIADEYHVQLVSPPAVRAKADLSSVPAGPQPLTSGK